MLCFGQVFTLKRCFLLSLSTKTITSILMPLSRLARINNFYSNSLFRSYASALLKPYRSRSFLTLSSHDFLDWSFFLFPVISTSIISLIWELMSPRMTWPYHRRRLWITVSPIFTTTPTLSRRTSVDTLATRLTPHIIWSYVTPPHVTLPHLQQ